MTRDDYDPVWKWEAADAQARWDEAQDEALRLSAERFDRERGDDVP